MDVHNIIVNQLVYPDPSTTGHYHARMHVLTLCCRAALRPHQRAARHPTQVWRALCLCLSFLFSFSFSLFSFFLFMSLAVSVSHLLVPVASLLHNIYRYLSQMEDLYNDLHVIKLPLQRSEVRGLASLLKFSELMNKAIKMPELA